LKSKSSVSSLERGLRWKALRILVAIQRYRARKGNPIEATRLRSRVRMNTHFFCLIFDWLREHGYCQVTKTRREGDPRHPVKLVTLTSAGEAAIPPLRRLRTLGNVKEIARKFCQTSSAVQELDFLLDLIVESFDMAYCELYSASRIEDFEWFRGAIEQRLREHLDENIGDRTEVAHDVYLIIRGIPRRDLFKDAEEAKRRGHFLTLNHRYILRKLANMQQSDLIAHNVGWANRVMSARPDGSESSRSFMDRVDPVKIVEREREERAIFNLPTQTMTFARDSYDFDPGWNIDIAKLGQRWNQSRIAKQIERKELMDDEWRYRLDWLRKNQPWRIRESGGVELILYEDRL
jgi:hypothetical protein